LKIKNYGCSKLDQGKRTAKSAVKIAVDMVKEKLISKKEAVLRIDPNSLDTLLHPTLDEKSSINVIANGLPASPGAASGKVVFTSEEAERLTGMMQDTILVRVGNVTRGYSRNACS
jgi:pyruvate,orthophosphate dikinase